MFPLTIFAGLLFLFFLLHFAECSYYEQKESWSHQNDNIEKQHVNSQKSLDMNMMIHGILLWASMGFLLPVGILIVRMSSSTRKDCHQTRNKILFYVHVILQVLSMVLVTIGAALSIIKFENEFNNSHRRIGLALYSSVYLQVLMGFQRTKRGARGRSAWYFFHWLFGTTICIVGILNVYTGLQAYHKKTSKSTTLWTIIFTAQVAFMSILYLFQDKWEYMQKQGLINHDGSVVSATCDQVESQNDVLNEPCRKSNALGTYFLKSNALNKLFQLT